jgi:hypothetical protein
VAAGRGVTVIGTVSVAGRPATRLRFSDRSSRGTLLTIRLRSAARSVRITLAPPSLVARGGRVAASRLPHSRQVVTVSVVDASAGRTQLSEKVAVAAR